MGQITRVMETDEFHCFWDILEGSHGPGAQCQNKLTKMKEILLLCIDGMSFRVNLRPGTCTEMIYLQLMNVLRLLVKR